MGSVLTKKMGDSRRSDANKGSGFICIYCYCYRRLSSGFSDTSRHRSFLPLLLPSPLFEEDILNFFGSTTREGHGVEDRSEITSPSTIFWKNLSPSVARIILSLISRSKAH
ncbi:hypothetical protein M9H77_17288 [Catharanthus roseus]|uniref:Uncharacterized protein n=1 Tax=Catharanthus roseus TaxID=4058 RepID=A0ACC0B457_CATRO|nr:hypothetical protein M9H77_17288 [Catharanthus roseus]